MFQVPNTPQRNIRINIDNSFASQNNNADNNIINIDRKGKIFKLDDYKLKDKCTFFEFGNFSLSQEPFYCEICDPNKTEMICGECFSNCHRFCNKDEMKEIEIKDDNLPNNLPKKDKFMFICECGKKKHEIERKIDKELEKKCQFGDFDKSMKRKYKTFCKTCNFEICYICNLFCHRRKNGCQCEKQSIHNNNKEKEIETEFICQCQNQKHSNIIIMIQIINRMIEREEYEEVKHLWSIQIFNTFCLSKMSYNLFDEAQMMISDFKNDSNFKKDLFNVRNRFIRLGIMLSKAKHFFYFKDVYITQYPFTKIIECILSFKSGQFEKYGNFICCLCYFFYFLNLKKDFQTIKGLCIMDFIITSPLMRILYRHLINTNNIYTYKIFIKYYEKKNKKYCLDDICINLLFVLDRAFNDFTIEKLDKCIKKYLIIFKIIYFCLKRFLFNFNSLESLVEILLRLSTKIYHLVCSHIETEKYQGETLQNLMNYITKINCAIVFNYNDLILEEIIFNKKKKYNNYNFLHYENPFSNKVGKILIITSLVYGKFKVNKKEIDKQYIRFLNSILENFLLTNNVYLKKLNECNNNSFEIFYNRLKKIQTLKDEVNHLEIPYFKGEKYIPDRLEISPTELFTIEDNIRRSVFNLKEELEMEFKSYFHFIKDISSIETEICELLNSFCYGENKLTSYNNINITNNYKAKLTEVKGNEKESKNKSFNSILNQEMLRLYKRKMITQIGKYYPFIKQAPFSQNVDVIEILIDEFILSSLDTTITKIFLIDKSEKIINEETIQSILNFLLIYTLTKSGLENFSLGRNFKRLIKCFKVFPRVTLKFLKYLFKGIELYDIKIKSHKRIPQLVSIMIEYLKKYIIKSVDEENKFKEDFIQSVKTFKSLSHLISIKTLEEIKCTLCSVLKEKKITDVKHFGIFIPLYFIYSKDGHIEREAEANIKFMASNFKYVTNNKNDLQKKEEENKKKEELSESEEKPISNDKVQKDNKKDNIKDIEKQFAFYKSELLAKYLVKLKKVFSSSSNIQSECNSQNTTFVRPLNIDTKITTRLNEKFLFSLLSMISYTTFYTKKNEAYKLIAEFLDIEFLQFLLKRKYLKIKYRIILLEFLRNFYLSDQIYNNNNLISINTQKYPNNAQYIKIVNFINNENDNKILLTEMTNDEINNKLKEVQYIKVIIEIIDNEMDIMNLVINESKRKLLFGLMYISEIIQCLKCISDIFLTYDITSHVTLWFYQIVLKFLKRSKFFSKFLLNIQEHNRVDILDLSDITEEQLNERPEGDIEKKDYDIYNKEDLYLKFFIEFQNLYSRTSYNADFNLKQFLTFYKNANDMDFKKFSLNHTQDEISSLAENLTEKDTEGKETSTFYCSQTLNINNIRKAKEKLKHKRPNKKPLDKAYSHYRKSIALYISQFVNLSKLTLINIILTKSNDITIEFKDVFFEYVLSLFYHIKNVPDSNVIALLILTNKILFFDCEKTQMEIMKIMQKLNNEQSEEGNIKFEDAFFENYQSLIGEIITMQIILAKNERLISLYKNFTLLSKNMIQFLQLLGEGHSKVFQHFLVNGSKKKQSFTIHNRNRDYITETSQKSEEDEEMKEFSLVDYQNIDNSPSIFTVLCDSLNTSLKLINLFNNDNINRELPYDKLVVLIINIIDCIVKFFQGTNKEGYIDMYSKVKICFDSMRNIIKLQIPNELNPRRRFIIIVKTFILELIASLIEEGLSDDPDIKSLKDIMVVFQPIDLFSEIVLCFESIYKKFKSSLGELTLENPNIIERFIELYKFNQKFQMSIELKLAFQIFYIMRIIAEVYNRVEVVNFFKRIESEYQVTIEEKEEEEPKKEISFISESLVKEINTTKLKDNINITNDRGILPLGEEIELADFSQLNNDKVINQSQSKIPIVDNQNINELIPSILNSNTKQLKDEKEKMRKTINNMKQDMYSKENEDKSSLLISQLKKHFVIYSFLKTIMTRIEIRNNEKITTRDFSLFVVPPVCLLLSEPTRMSFTENVDRETVSKKILSLIDETDYFIFEMFYNKTRFSTFSKIEKIFSNINFKHFEYANYCFFLLQNVLMVIHNFSFKEGENKHKNNLDALIISGIHVVFIFFVMIIWFIYKFELHYKHEVMQKYKEKFIFSKGENRSEHLTEAEEELVKKVGQHLTFGQKLYIIAKYTILENREINIFVFSLLFIILHLILYNGLLIAIPLLFIANLNAILYGIIYSLKSRFKQLLIVLIYTYLIVYIFSWISFYYFQGLFVFDVINPNDEGENENIFKEHTCSTMLQCFMTMLNYGVRSGGGIGDVLAIVKYQNNHGYYIGEFFFVVLFHIMIIWIMLNLFFGIIVDTFATLREKTYRTEEDKNNRCYICQITRDRAINKNINFDRHISTIHCIWNYVYFMTYLHINNTKNFKTLETFVWNKIPKSDTSWLPLDEEIIEKED